MADQGSITVQLTLTGEQGAPKVPLTISKSITAADLRKSVSEATKIPSASLRLIFRGRMIGDDATKQVVSDFKLEEGSVIHCMGKPVKDGAPPSSAPTSSAAAVPSAATMPAGSRVTIQPSSAASAASTPNSIEAALQSLRSLNTPADYQTAVSTLDKVLSNIIDNPLEEKYRRVKKHNPAFQRRLGGIRGGDAAMIAAGFVSQMDGSDEVYMIQASAEAWPKLLATKATVEAAVRDAKSASGQPRVPSQPGTVPLFPNAGAFGGAPPDMQGAMANLLSDPNALQAMMRNPMVQQMMRNDPRFANNPMMQQVMQDIANNPALASQMSQMMSDPNMMRQMQAMMQQQGGRGFPGAMFPPMGSTGTANTGAGQQQPSNAGGGAPGSSSSQNDQEMTEEEMIAEAIRRSLQDS